MKLKGHTTIELTDVNTGKKEVHEDDNLITNAISEILGYHGSMSILSADSLFAIDTTNGTYFSPIKKLTGGLMLFDTQIEENVETVREPAGISLVGCASGISYNGANVMAGSYNKQESGKVDRGYKHVWDFGTSQSNGQIACACLTTMLGGKITTGSFPFSQDYKYHSGDSKDIVDESFLLACRNPKFVTKCEGQTSPMYDTSTSILFIDAKRNRLIKTKHLLYSFNNTSNADYFQKSIFNNKSIDLDVERCGFSTFSILDSPGSQNTVASMPYGSLVEETIHVEMPEALKAKITNDMLESNKIFGVCTCCDDNYIYFVITLPSKTGSRNIIEKDEKFYVWRINAETFESSYFEVTNTINEPIWFSVSYIGGLSSYQGITQIIVFDDYIILAGYDSKKAYCMKLSDNTAVSEVKYPDGSNLIVKANTNTVFGIYYYLSGAGKVCINLSGLNSDDRVIVIDPVLNIATYKNITAAELGMTHGGYYNYTRKSMHIANSLFFANIWAQDNFVQIKPYFDPSVLISINNLSSPVLKTASQTMKVTYTLTLADA